jgi:hypothetical protein
MPIVDVDILETPHNIKSELFKNITPIMEEASSEEMFILLLPNPILPRVVLGTTPVAIGANFKFPPNPNDAKSIVYEPQLAPFPALLAELLDFGANMVE